MDGGEARLSHHGCDGRDGTRPALLQRLAAVRGRLSLCADQAAAAKWWFSMPMASVSAEGPTPKALSTRRTSPLIPGCRHQWRACPLRSARMTSNSLIVAWAGGIGLNQRHGLSSYFSFPLSCAIQLLINFKSWL